jgi:hypothetical protein
MDPDLPQTLGYEAAGIVDELGEGVADVSIGDRVFGFSAEGAAQAELAVLSLYAPIPAALGSPKQQRCRPSSISPWMPPEAVSCPSSSCSSAEPSTF